MGITLGWIAFLLAGVTDASPAERNAAQISYTVRMVEAEGVGWRASVMSQLKPVTRQGAATVWTLPKSTTKRLIREICKSPAGVVVQAPRVTALSGVAATIQVRQNRKFVTQVAWNGEETAPEETPENLRVGWHTTMVGRRLDQGILVKIVFEDTEIRGIHQVKLAAPSDANMISSGVRKSGLLEGKGKATLANPLVFEGSPFETSSSGGTTTENVSDASQDSRDADAAKKRRMRALMDKAMTAYADGKFIECEALARRAMEVDPDELAARMLVYKAQLERRFKADSEHRDETENADVRAFEEIDRLSSNGSPFGSVQSLRVIKEKGTSCCDEANQSQTTVQPVADKASCENRVLELPEIANQEVLGEWLIPNGECLLVSFGPHTVADKSGKAVVRERLAFVEADEQTSAMANSPAPFHFIPAPPVPIPPPAPFGAVAAPVAPARVVPYSSNGRPVHGVPPSPAATVPPALFMPTPLSPHMGGDVPAAPPPAPSGAALPMPAVPSRAIPEGVHVDGSKAALPPLPEDEMEDDAADSESAEPRPSPQTKKPRKPKPESDESATKVSFTKPRSSTIFLPSVFLPGASVGFQFLLPIGPLSIKLPFNQRLEIEVFGRVVPDAQPSGGAK